MFCSSFQRTALHLAAEKGHTAACQLLISAESDVNATDWCAFMFKISATDFVLHFVIQGCFFSDFMF
jgi:ankyrin repeat protein